MAHLRERAQPTPSVQPFRRAVRLLHRAAYIKGRLSEVPLTAAYITGPDTTVRRQGDALAVTAAPARPK